MKREAGEDIIGERATVKITREGVKKKVLVGETIIESQEEKVKTKMETDRIVSNE